MVEGRREFPQPLDGFLQEIAMTTIIKFADVSVTVENTDKVVFHMRTSFLGFDEILKFGDVFQNFWHG